MVNGQEDVSWSQSRKNLAGLEVEHWLNGSSVGSSIHVTNVDVRRKFGD